jgi:hypothetical protein
MAKPKKSEVPQEVVIEETVLATEDNTVSESTTELEPSVTNFVHVPDIPAQMSDEQEFSLIKTLHKESEAEFLTRILHIQHEGGFGRHLDEIIKERINSL